MDLMGGFTIREGEIEHDCSLKSFQIAETREICGEKIISGEGLNQVNFSKFIRLNDSAAFLLKKVEHEEFTAETLAKLLCEEYEISEEIAAKDAEALCKSLVEAGIVEE